MISLYDAAQQFELALTREQLDTFERYYHELIEWNARINLTAITDYNQVIVKHFLDSISIAPLLQSFGPTGRLVDIGTGAGLPGIPLKIVLPDWHVTLLEATGKKVDFLNHVIAQLDLRNITAVHARAEDLGQDPTYREQFDVAVARAVARMATLVEYALPLVHIGGWFIAQKGVDVDEELESAVRALDELGGRVHQIVPVQLPGLDKRHLIVVEKIARTSVKYPRRAGLPERKPLTK